LAALEARELIYQSVEALLENYDAILCLSAPGPAPHGFETTGSAIFNGLWTLLGVPCLSIPLLTVDGLPQGVQLVGKRGEEGKLFRSAHVLCEKLNGKLDENYTN
jgi:Asp-tRNA(Asn)/Glu-tRNA(Gln) amidotransferase A subunit family amidase